tara:strand:- start:691 stop:1020 length:330 start_codon:yes stop_codon:yes gene_type:complete
MAFKMKGFSPFTQTVPKNVDDYSNFPGLRKELTKDTSKREKTVFKQTEEAVAGAKAGGTAKHPLYGKLTADEKKKYDALSAAEKSNVNKNKELHQLKNALGGPGEEDDK